MAESPKILHTKNQIFTFIFIFIEVLLLLIICILSVMIKNLLSHKVEGAYITVLHNEDMIFTDKELKYFFEPRPNSIQVDSPYWLGYKATYTINSDSLNAVREYSEQKNDHTYRILTIGDSFTFGAHVNITDSYPEVLEGILNNRLQCADNQNFEVLNLGVGGYDVEFTVNRLIKRGLKYHPDLVIWLIKSPNFEKIDSYLYSIIEDLVKTGVPQNIEKDNIIYPVAQEKATQILQEKYGYSRIKEYQYNAMQKLLKYYNGKLLIIGFPTMNKEDTAFVGEFVKGSENYIFVDKLFDYWSDKSYQLPDKHPSIQGHKKIAEDIFEYLHKNILTSCEVEN